MLTCGVLTPAAVSSQLVTGTLVALLSVAFACGSWARAGLYCNGQVSHCQDQRIKDALQYKRVE